MEIKRPPPFYFFFNSSGIDKFPFPFLPPLSALFFNLAIEEEEANRLSVVNREIALISTSARLSSSSKRLFLTLEGVILLSS